MFASELCPPSAVDMFSESATEELYFEPPRNSVRRDKNIRCVEPARPAKHRLIYRFEIKDEARTFCLMQSASAGIDWSTTYLSSIPKSTRSSIAIILNRSSKSKNSASKLGWLSLGWRQPSIHQPTSLCWVISGIGFERKRTNNSAELFVLVALCSCREWRKTSHILHFTVWIRNSIFPNSYWK